MNRFALFCLAAATAAAPAIFAAEPGHIHFADITHAAGIRFSYNNGAFGKKYLPETLGPGVAFIDYDGDGWQDIFLVNGTAWPGHPGAHTTPALYHNNHDGTFTDVTKKAGLAVPMYGMGAAVGDYNNDGHDDLLVTTYGQNHLFRNNGNGTFTDVTRAAGLAGPHGLSTSVAWVDYDRDGHLDLLVANYVQWTPEADRYCTMDGRTKSYCTPEAYKGASLTLWHNRGNGTFEDVTRKAGLEDATAKGMGIAVLDANRDGWPDLVTTNDTQANRLYINNKNGTFTDQAVLAGVAFSEDGLARAGMGVDADDYDHSGWPGILITNFSNQMVSLYRNDRNGMFTDVAPQLAVGRDTLLTLGFGCFFFDYDLDGWDDIFVADGHLDPVVEQTQQRVKYAEPPHLFRNLGGGSRFDDVTAQMGASFNEPRVERGAAYGDINNDGAPDILVATNTGPVLLFENQGSTNHALRIHLVGTRSNRDGMGATVRVQAANGVQQSMLRSGSSYLSASELVLTFGLGSAAQADSIEIHWPSGAVDHLKNVRADQSITVKEGAGVVHAQPLAHRA